MDLSYFTYVTGLASLLGLLLQVFNIFPKYGKIRNTISLIVFGVFLGSFIKAFDSSSIKLDFSIDGYIIICTLFILVILSSLLASFIIKDPTKRENLHAIAAIGIFIFIFVLFIGFTIRSGTSTFDKKKLSITEIILLANDNEKRANFDKAIMHYESIINRLPLGDPRRKVIKEKINDLKLKQVR